MLNNFEENEYPIYTNNLNVKINRMNVDREFIVFQIGTDNLRFHDNVLDVASEKFKAQSVAYYRNNRWFAMFKKESVRYSDFKTEVLANDESAIVNVVDLFEYDQSGKNGIKDVELAQLLVNSLKNRNNELFAYNNITGALYYSFDAKRNAKTFKLLKLRFFTPTEKSSMIALEANTETFSECSALKKYSKKKVELKYVFDDETGEFRRKLRDDYGNHCRFFDKGALSREGNRKKFLDFSNNDNFLKSKTGVIATFLIDVKENLDDFICLSQIPIKEYNSNDESNVDYENKDYKSLLRKRGVFVNDTVKSSESRQMKMLIENYLAKEYELCAFSDNQNSDNYTIEIVLNTDDSNYSNAELTQHLTVENTAAKIDSQTIKDVMHNIVQELLIKGDLHDKKISLVKWNEPKEWTFVRCGTGRWNNQKKCNEYTYYRMKISEDGGMDIDVLMPSEFPTGDWEVVDMIFREYNNGRKNSPVECVVYDGQENINVIYQTKQFTLPNVESLSEIIRIADCKNVINKNLLKAYIEEYQSENQLSQVQADALSIIKGNLDACLDINIPFGKIREICKDGEKIGSIKPKTINDFIQWLYDKTSESENPILLHPQLKSGKNLSKNFSSVLGVKSTQLEGKFKYFVGVKKKSLKTSLPYSCRIRDVIPWNKGGENPRGKILFSELSHMLTVEFVRNGQYTVVPFPIKYLNEYIRFREKDDSFEEDS
jgi:hypothetical protein